MSVEPATASGNSQTIKGAGKEEYQTRLFQESGYQPDQESEEAEHAGPCKMYSLNRQVCPFFLRDKKKEFSGRL